MVSCVSEKHVVTAQMQSFLKLLADKKNLTWKEQYVYNDRRSFLRAMNQLIAAGWIKKDKDIFIDGINDVFRLTLKGEVITDALGEFERESKKILQV